MLAANERTTCGSVNHSSGRHGRRKPPEEPPGADASEIRSGDGAEGTRVVDGGVISVQHNIKSIASWNSRPVSTRLTRVGNSFGWMWKRETVFEWRPFWTVEIEIRGSRSSWNPGLCHSHLHVSMCHFLQLCLVISHINPLYFKKKNWISIRKPP